MSHPFDFSNQRPPHTHRGLNSSSEGSLKQKMYDCIVRQEEVLQQLGIDLNERLASLEDALFELTDSVVNIEKKTLSSYSHVKSIANSLRIPAESDMENHHFPRTSRRGARNRARPTKLNSNIPIQHSTYKTANRMLELPESLNLSSSSDTDNNTIFDKDNRKRSEISLVPPSNDELFGLKQSIQSTENLKNASQQKSELSFSQMEGTSTTTDISPKDHPNNPLQKTQNCFPETTKHDDTLRSVKNYDSEMQQTEEKTIPNHSGDNKGSNVGKLEPVHENTSETKAEFHPGEENSSSSEFQSGKESVLKSASNSEAQRQSDDSSLKTEPASHSSSLRQVESEQSVQDLTLEEKPDHQEPVLDLSSPESVISSLGVANNSDAVAAITKAYHSSTQQDVKAKGLYTVLLLDNSASMEGEAFKQMTNFVGQFLDEVDMAAGEKFLDETVAIVTCGGQTGVAVDFTIDYTILREFISKMKPNGKTPLQTALAVALCYIHKHGEVLSIQGLTVLPRIILVSDGKVTDDVSFLGPDQEPTATHIQTQTKILNLTKSVKQFGYPMYCVGVGEYNQAYLCSMVQGASGKLETIDRACVLGRYYYFQTIVSKVLEQHPVEAKRENLQQIIQTIEPDFDPNHMAEIVSLIHGETTRIHKASTSPPLAAGRLPHATSVTGSQPESSPRIPAVVPPNHQTGNSGSFPHPSQKFQVSSGNGLLSSQAHGVSSNHIQGMPPNRTQGLPPSQAQSLQPNHTQGMPPNQAQGLQPNHTQGMPPSQTQELSTSPPLTLSPNQTKTLSPNQTHVQISPLAQHSQHDSSLASSQGACAAVMEWETCDLQERVSLLVLGSRVLRGPHWQYGNDDEGLPGTVVGHKDKDHLYVLWDCGKSGVYRYGVNSEIYDVFLTDQIRTLASNNTLQIGCKVKRGPHWDRFDEDGGQNTIGSVVRIHDAYDVSVRWPIGIFDKYKYDPNGIQEIMLASFSEVDASVHHVQNVDSLARSHDSSSSSQLTVVWRWSDRLNNWHLFDQTTSSKIESDYKKDKDSTVINLDGCNLRLIFSSKMEYRDFQNKIKGKIERMECTPEKLLQIQMSESEIT